MVHYFHLKVLQREDPIPKVSVFLSHQLLVLALNKGKIRTLRLHSPHTGLSINNVKNLNGEGRISEVFNFLSVESNKRITLVFSLTTI